MPSSVDFPRSSAALAGLALATTIAHEATDGVPVVNQILGVVLRIVTLAEERPYISSTHCTHIWAQPEPRSEFVHRLEVCIAGRVLPNIFTPEEDITANTPCNMGSTEREAVWLWAQNGEGIFLDEHGEPTIGLEYDLWSMSSVDMTAVHTSQIEIITALFTWPQLIHAKEHRQTFPLDELADGGWWRDARFSEILTGEYHGHYTRQVAYWSEIKTLPPPSAATMAYLMRADLAHDRANNLFAKLQWGCVLFHLAMFQYSINPVVHALYFDRGVMDACTKIPLSRTFQVRRALGIVKAEDSWDDAGTIWDLDNCPHPYNSEEPAPDVLKWVQRPVWDCF
ncbi:hypothetical protein AURDEDRAFT_130795 [Auricularia subglabra TFB-10046 SS5]|uniref:Uncharacterized protein n=1 Tax=Auricularia subglabra (strain TFB-10046 / SS5) TaxID=717982 RepID=J0D7K6_AURST|nr:hypothetical protein AURDEDRAFT_130795 [Auricularia subglabra TFB-10046 SS5]